MADFVVQLSSLVSPNFATTALQSKAHPTFSSFSPRYGVKTASWSHCSKSLPQVPPHFSSQTFPLIHLLHEQSPIDVCFSKDPNLDTFLAERHKLTGGGCFIRIRICRIQGPIPDLLYQNQWRWNVCF